jgi:N-methylhydantoinase A
MLVGVDIGGTFTDLVLSTDKGLTIHKLPSTPHNPAIAMIEGLSDITDGNLSLIERVAHGSTVATNAILERKGAKTAFITTKGFRDILFIGRQNRPDLYALQPQLPSPLIPRELCYELGERLDHNGEIIQELNIDELNVLLDKLKKDKVDSVAVCFLYSYINPEHERIVQARIYQRQMMERWQVALSCEVLPEFREYERASTVALEAYVRPVIGNYINNLREELPENIGLRVMKSDGGVMDAGRVQEQAIQTALSGPAAGLLGAYHIAKLAGYNNVITLDMGGTSTDVAICPGELVRRPQSEIDGLPLRIRLLDIETIGAGGGSIARLDSGHALRVGPQSAGADPGPALYGYGGKDATVSDANAVLGRLDTDYFLGGNMSLDTEAAHKVVTKLAEEMDLSIEDAAQGIIDVANVNIERALRRVSVARGYDPRDFTLVAFGGAGALHACQVAERLSIPRVLVPRYPGVLCAFGLLVADVVFDYSRSVLGIATDATMTELAPLIEDLITRGRGDLVLEDIPRTHRNYVASLDVRYKGQAYELNIPLSGVTDIRDAFHETHQLTYGYSMPERDVEIVNLRVQAVGSVEHAVLQEEDDTIEEDEFDGATYAVPGDALIGTKETVTGTPITLYEREMLSPGARFSGEALIFQLDSTIYIPQGWLARIDGYRNLILERA